MKKYNLKFYLMIMLFLVSFVIILLFLNHDKNIQNEYLHYSSILKSYCDTHLITSIFIYSILLIVSAALSLPITAICMIISGYLFGISGIIISLICASVGSFGPYLTAKYFTTSMLRRNALKYMKKIHQNLSDTKFNYYICLRLFPLIPFPITSAIGGVLNLNPRTYFINTLVGVLPSCIALNLIGLQINDVFHLNGNILVHLLKQPVFFITTIIILLLFVLPAFFLKKRNETFIKY